MRRFGVVETGLQCYPWVGGGIRVRTGGGVERRKVEPSSATFIFSGREAGPQQGPRGSMGSLKLRLPCLVLSQRAGELARL